MRITHSHGGHDGQSIRVPSPRFFYGWVVVATCFVAQMFTSLAMQGLSTYVAPLQREFGWSAGLTAAGRSVQQADTFLGPLNGWLVDRFGPRRLMSVGVILFAVSFVAFGLTDSLWTFYGACLLMALANSLLGLLVVSYAVNRWFRRKRTAAMGLAVTGFAVAGAVFIPLVVWAQTAYGWRVAAFWTAAGMLLLGLPIVLLMRDSPEALGLLRDGDRPESTDAAPAAGSARGLGLVDFTLGQALRTRAFWYVTLGNALATLTQAGLVVHQFPHLERFLDRETAALVLSSSNVFNVAGRLLGGLLGDRLTKHVLLGMNCVLATVAIVLMAVGTSLLPLLLYGALFGFSWGVRAAVSNSLQADYFGRVQYGRIVGLTQTIASPAAIAAPIVVGVAADVLGGYRVPFLVLAVTSAFSALMFFVAVRPADPPIPARAA